MDECILWIWLSLAFPGGGGAYSRLLSEFGTAGAVFRADDEALHRCIGRASVDDNAFWKRDLTGAGEVYDFCRRHAVGLTYIGAPDYPAPLCDLQSSPAVIYYRGTLPDFSSGRFVSVVGTRHTTEYGCGAAFSLARDLAHAGVTIVSGMARGIDGVAMAGALSSGGRAVAVLGSGIDVCYPPEHLTLARATVKTGCIMTELPPGTEPTRFTFPQRNRIIAALSAATAVIEGRNRSGALITASAAKRLGRKVYALPGNVNSETSAAANSLIRDGAVLLTSAADILRDFGMTPTSAEGDTAEKMREWCDALSVCTGTEKTDIPAGQSTKWQSAESTERKRNTKKRAPRTGNGITAASVAAPAGFTEERGTRQIKNPSAECDFTAERKRAESLGAGPLYVYDRIPEHGDCVVDELAGGGYSIAEIMKFVLKLELSGLCEEVPGGRIARISH